MIIIFKLNVLNPPGGLSELDPFELLGLVKNLIEKAVTLSKSKPPLNQTMVILTPMLIFSVQPIILQ
jgi:hypothetical protein